jgi:hypothetical protein
VKKAVPRPPTRWRRAGRAAPRRGRAGDACARRTTPPATRCTLKQGALAEAALEVSRLEERIRYVVEGRQRAEQRLAELQAQNAQWAERRPQPRPSSSTSPSRSPPPTSRPRCCGAGRGAGRAAAAVEDAVRAAQGKQPTSSATPWPGAAADPGAGRRQPQHRRAVAASCAPPRPPGRRERRAAGARRGAPGRAAQQHAAAEERRKRPRRGCTS